MCLLKKTTDRQGRNSCLIELKELEIRDNKLKTSETSYYLVSYISGSAQKQCSRKSLVLKTSVHVQQSLLYMQCNTH